MVTLGELADLVQGELDGDPGIEITGVAEIQNAFPGTISFLHTSRYRKYLQSTQASAVVVSKDEPVGEIGAIRVDNPILSFSRILDFFSPGVPDKTGIHPTAIIETGVTVGKEVTIGAYTTIEEGVKLGDGVKIGPLCVVGSESEIGEESNLKFHTSISSRCVIGKHVIIHSGTVIGSDGFGYATDKGTHVKIRQIGRVVIEDKVEIGANCAIDRGTISDTVIGEGTKLDNLVHIAHNVKIGKGCLITGQFGIAGSSVLGDYVAFGGQSGVGDNVEVGSHARFAAKSGVTKSLPGNKTYAGMPAIEIMERNRLDVLVHRLPELVKKVNKLEAEIKTLKESR